MSTLIALGSLAAALIAAPHDDGPHAAPFGIHKGMNVASLEVEKIGRNTYMGALPASFPGWENRAVITVKDDGTICSVGMTSNIIQGDALGVEALFQYQQVRNAMERTFGEPSKESPADLLDISSGWIKRVDLKEFSVGVSWDSTYMDLPDDFAIVGLSIGAVSAREAYLNVVYLFDDDGCRPGEREYGITNSFWSKLWD